MTIATELATDADQMDQERTQLEGAAVKGMPRIGRTFTRQGSAWIRDLLVGRPNFQPAQDQMTDALVDSMVASFMLGKLRAFRMAAPAIARGVTFFAFDPDSVHSRAVAWLKQRVKLDQDELATLAERFTPQALEVTRGLTLEAEQAAQAASRKIVSEGMHVRQATTEMSSQLARVGVAAPEPWLLETLVRTQIQTAYGAGRWQGSQDPAIQEILWGYKYVTVGDDAVRLNHEALEGTTLPKDHPRWNEIWPPNGFNCRCVAVEIFKDEAPKTPQVDVRSTAIVDGIEVVPQPDQGWAFNPGQIL